MGADSSNFGVVNEVREHFVVRQVAQRISVALVMPGWE